MFLESMEQLGEIPYHRVTSSRLGYDVTFLYNLCMFLKSIEQLGEIPYY